MSEARQRTAAGKTSTEDPIGVDPYVFDVLLPDLVGHDRSAAAFLVYLLLWRECGRDGTGTAQRSLRELAEGTGLSKRSVQTALGRLHKRRLISVERGGITDVPHYTVIKPWRR